MVNITMEIENPTSKYPQADSCTQFSGSSNPTAQTNEYMTATTLNNTTCSAHGFPTAIPDPFEGSNTTIWGLPGTPKTLYTAPYGTWTVFTPGKYSAGK